MGSMKKGEENRYRVCEGGEVQRSRRSCKYRCVRGWSPRLVFIATKRGGRYLGTCKRQPYLIEDNVEESAALITEDRRLRSFLSGGRVFRLNWIKVRGLESAIFKSAL